MNYLAHAFLSKNDDHLLIGNFIADHLRGNDFSAYTPRIIEGIHLHRKIDNFTDTHTEFKKSKRIFYNGFEKYSGVLVDIYFDHLLAKNFLKHSKEDLYSFAKKVYEVYTNHQHLIPASSSRFLEYVIQNNIYYSYSTIQGIEKVLFHLSHRIKHGVQLNNSVVLFNKHEKELQENFDAFFKDVMNEFYN
jgi:acyl carrier protein phosphodiesterase